MDDMLTFDTCCLSWLRQIVPLGRLCTPSLIPRTLTALFYVWLFCKMDNMSDICITSILLLLFSDDLFVKRTGVHIWANEVWGALRGLETFSQIVFKGTNQQVTYSGRCALWYGRKQAFSPLSLKWMIINRDFLYAIAR